MLSLVSYLLFHRVSQSARY